jgi:hypothetical protein
MTGRRRSRATKATGKSSPTAAVKPTATATTHLVAKDGEPHDDVVSTVEPTHGSNADDRMDIVADPDAPAPEPMKENAVPATRRIDEGQNRGDE